MTYSGGVLGGITRNGQPLSATDGFGKFSGGALEASFNLRDQVLVDAQESIDLMAADLISRFEDPSTDPTLTAGMAGLLTDSGAPYTAADLVGLSSRLSVNTAIDPDAGGSLSRLRDGIGAISARWDTLNASVLADGVDTDYEMQMLLQIEQSYAANAKLIQAADRMLQSLMEI